MIKYNFKGHLLILFVLIFSISNVLAEDKKLVVKVGVFQLAPMVYIDDNGTPQGIFVDVIEAIASEEDWEIEYVEGTWNDGLERVKKGQIDLMTAVMHLPRREAFLDFPKEAAFNIWGQLYIHKEDNLSGVFDMKWKTVGVLKGGANGENFIELLTKLGIQVKLVAFDTQEDVAQAIKEKSVDAGVFTNVHGYNFQQSHQLKQTQIVFNPSFLKYATSKGTNQQLLLTIDNYLSKWKKNLNSPYHKIIEKHLGLSEAHEIPDWVRDLVLIGTITLGVSLLVVFFLMGFNKKLKNEVKARTQDLLVELDRRKNTEEKLIKSEDRLQGIVYSIADWIWEVDCDGRYTYCSKKVKSLLGYTPEEMIGKTLFDSIAPDDVKKIREVFNENVAQKKPIKDLENWNIRKNEQRVCLLTNGVPIIDKNGELLGFRGVDKDITENKLKDIDLRKSEEKFRTAFHTSPSAFTLTSLEDGTFLDVNDGFTKLLGYSQEEVIGQSSFVLNTWNNLKDRERLVSGLKKNGVVENLEAELKGKDGQIINGLMSARILDIDNKKALLAITQDITEKKKIERDTQALVESTAGIIGQDFFDITAANLCEWLECDCTIIGEITSDGMVKSISMILDGESVNDYSYPLKGSPCEEAANEGYCVYAENVTAFFPNDTDLIDMDAVGYVGASLQGRTGEVTGVICCISRNKLSISKQTQDVMKIIAARISAEIGRKVIEKEKDKLESQIGQNQKMESVGTLAGGIAHDFNNILFPILGHTEMLIEDVPKDSPFQDGLNEIYTGALRAKGLVKQILTFSRQENSELKLLKIQPIINEALKFIRATIPTTISIKQDLQADCGVIKADPTQIHQVIMNLATNASHAMEDTGGELNVRLKEIELGEYDLINSDITPGNFACLKVTDTGKGMDKDLIKKIFDPFYTTKEKGKGTGMGLSVVHGIVNSMGGAIQVYSEPGKGTEFTVYVPVEKSYSEQQRTQVKKSIKGGNEHILLVDDEKSIIKMEEQMLKRLGYKVTSRISSIEALEAFRVNPAKFDLVITDMAMPNLSGDKLAVELIKIRSDIPILLCTGYSENTPQEKAASLSTKGFLMKPIVMKDLAQKIREVLDEKNS